MLSSKYNIQDPEVKRAMDELERMIMDATAGRDKGQVTQSKVRDVSEKSVTVDEQNKRLVAKIGNELYGTTLTKI